MKWNKIWDDIKSGTILFLAVCLITLLVGSLVFLIILLIINACNLIPVITNPNSTIENIGSASDVLVNNLMAIGAFALGFLAIFELKEYLKNKRRERAKDAFEITRHFVTELADARSGIENKIAESDSWVSAGDKKLATILLETNTEKISSFSKEELENIYSTEERIKLKSFYTKVDVDKECIQFLNRLESICLYINKLDDDEMFFRELYPSIKRSMQLSYYIMCAHEESGKNIKKVFLLWRQKTREDLEFSKKATTKTKIEKDTKKPKKRRKKYEKI